MKEEYAERKPWAFGRMVLRDRRRIIPIPARKGTMETRIKMTINFLRSLTTYPLKAIYTSMMDREMAKMM
jgi:hypothetical protein